MSGSGVAQLGEDFLALTKTLSGDLIEVFERLQKEPFHQPSRRSWVRTLCSQIEAWAFGMKQLLAELSVLPWVKLTPGEVLLLRDETCEIDSNGDLNVRSGQFVSIEKNLRFVAKAIARAMSSTYVLPVGTEGWEALKQTLSIRNRLVHPKKRLDLEVTDHEMIAINAAHTWFQQAALECLAEVDRGLKGHRS